MALSTILEKQKVEFVNQPNLSSFQDILVTDISDHLPIIHIDTKCLPINNDDFIYRRNLSQRNKHAFRLALAKLIWQEICHETDMQRAFSKFHSKSLINIHFSKKKIRYNSRKSWLTQGLKDAIVAKNKMYKVYLEVPSACNESKYKTYMNKLNHILKKAEKQHYTDLLAANKK